MGGTGRAYHHEIKQEQVNTVASGYSVTELSVIRCPSVGCGGREAEPSERLGEGVPREARAGFPERGGGPRPFARSQRPSQGQIEGARTEASALGHARSRPHQAELQEHVLGGWRNGGGVEWAPGRVWGLESVSQG